MLRAKSAPFITRGQPRGGPSHNSNTAQLQSSFNCLTTDCQGRGRPRQGPSGGSWVPRSRNRTHRPRTGTQISLCLDPDRTVSIKTIDLMVYNNRITIDGGKHGVHHKVQCYRFIGPILKPRTNVM